MLRQTTNHTTQTVPTQTPESQLQQLLQQCTRQQYFLPFSPMPIVALAFSLVTVSNPYSQEAKYTPYAPEQC
jgi:uncharacterized protein YybS (DUF2232 family)